MMQRSVLCSLYLVLALLTLTLVFRAVTKYKALSTKYKDDESYF